MLFECSGLKTITNTYVKVASVVEHSYKCEWEDEVHDSFGKYVQQCGEQACLLKDISNKMEHICQELNALHISQEKEEIKKLNCEAEQLCGKARSLL